MIETTQIADDMPIPVILLDGVGQSVSWANQAAQSWLKVSLKTLSGQPLSAFFQESQSLVDAAEKAKSYLTPVTVPELVIHPRLAREEKCRVTAFIHEDSVGLSFVRHGRQTQKDDVFGDGASALGRLLAHEIKNPLAGIQGAAQLLRHDVKDGEAVSLLDLIEAEIGRIGRLAERMERLGDVMPLQFSQINIHEILRHARKVIQSGLPPKFEFSENYDPSLPLISGHADSLTQAVMNLIKNAVEAFADSSESCQIALETHYRSSGNRLGLPIEICIKDNGSGISEHLRDNIFQPFITSKSNGQGLGLAQVSKVIAAHGGVVEVQSRPGETIFSILLPYSKGDDGEI